MSAVAVSVGGFDFHLGMRRHVFAVDRVEHVENLCRVA